MNKIELYFPDITLNSLKTLNNLNRKEGISVGSKIVSYCEFSPSSAVVFIIYYLTNPIVYAIR